MRVWPWGIILLGIGCGRSPAGGAAEFGPVELVSSASSNGATPMLAVAPNGDRVLSWVADSGGQGVERLHLAVTRADGGEVVRSELRDPLGGIEPHGEAPPQLAIGEDGGLYVLYTVGREVPGQRFPSSALRFARSGDGGVTWSAPVSVNEGEAFGSHNFHSLLVAPGGVVYAAWLSSVRGASGVWMRRSDDGGASWGPSRAILSEPACPCCRTALAVGPQGELYAAWRSILPGDIRDIVVMRSDDGGTTWGEPVRPRAHDWVYPGCPHAGPSMRVDGEGAVHIAWWTGVEGEAGVWYGRSDDGGRSFAATPVATGAHSRPAHVQLVLAASGPVVAWDDGLGSVPGILVRPIGDEGRSIRLSPEGEAASFPVLAAVGDSVLVAWSQVGLAAHLATEAAKPDMSDPAAVASLPRVGQSEIFLRAGRLVPRQ